MPRDRAGARGIIVQQDAGQRFDDAIKMHKTGQKSAQGKRDEALEKDDYDAAGAHDAEMTQFAGKIDEEEAAKTSYIEKLQEDFETAKERWESQPQ